MGFQSWTRALRALLQLLSGAEGYKWVGKTPASAWLRRDIGLCEEVVIRDRVDEVRRRYGAWG